MADLESLDYLEPGFDAKSLTMPRLRSILVAHNVNYPASAKKAQLVDIFNENVMPQAKKILAQRARAKRSSKGISDAEAAQDTHIFNDHEDLQPPPPSIRSRRSQSPRKASMRIKSEEPEHMLMPAQRSPSKRSSRASSRQLAHSEDFEATPEAEDILPAPRVRQTPREAPKLKLENSEEGFFRRESGAFTMDNPFQSGSPPPVEKTPTNRRRTAGYADNSRPTSSSSHRRRTEEPAYPGAEDSSMAASLEIPVERLVRGKTPEPLLEPAMDIGEEFTPEEQLELAAEEALNGEVAVVRATQARPTKQSNWGTSFSVLLITLLSVYAGWYRQEKIAVGYCGVGQATGSIPSEVPVPEWAQSTLGDELVIPQQVIDALEPQCEPCPAHAYCYGDFTVRCEPDYILQPHPFALGGLIPLPPTCEPDGEKARRVQAVADRAVEELRERTAKFECGELVNEAGEVVESAAIAEEDLKDVISQKKSKKMTNQEFEELWGAAIGEIKAREEVEVEDLAIFPAHISLMNITNYPNKKENSTVLTSETNQHSRRPHRAREANSGTVSTTLTSTSLARVPFTCAIKRSIRLGLARYRLQISALISLVLTVLYGRNRFVSNRAAAAQVPALVDLVLERLASQQQVADDEDDPWLFLPNLRDDVLRSVHSLRQREKIWQRVRAVVEQNSNVRTSQREGRSGEVGRAWEWIGPTADGGRRRKSGRVSWGPDVRTESDSPGVEEKSHLHQKWEESRPIY
ncbi:Man1-Src1p-C-terminal domain-containing protein [Xylariales sp. PMI_506]|nr:Man1-Src1p-C-terminal domain-containing protein [Xylariales sp. PMI_506]